MLSLLLLSFSSRLPPTLCSTTPHPAYYRVTTNTTDLAGIAGLYQLTDQTTAPAIGYVRPVYKKQGSLPSYILQNEVGDWVITFDITGSKFGLKQQSNYKQLDELNGSNWTSARGDIAEIHVSGMWACGVENNTQYMSEEKVDKFSNENITECLEKCETTIKCVALTYFNKGGFCVLHSEVSNTSHKLGAKSIRINCSSKESNWSNFIESETSMVNDSSASEVGQKKISEPVLIGLSVSCGLLVVFTVTIVAICVMTKRHKDIFPFQN